MPANGRVSSKKGKEEREGESAGGETVRKRKGRRIWRP